MKAHRNISISIWRTVTSWEVSIARTYKQESTIRISHALGCYRSPVFTSWLCQLPAPAPRHLDTISPWFGSSHGNPPCIRNFLRPTCHIRAESPRTYKGHSSYPLSSDTHSSAAGFTPFYLLIMIYATTVRGLISQFNPFLSYLPGQRATLK